MKVSKRTEEARSGNITRPHIVLEDGFWFFFCPKKSRASQARHAIKTLDFCRKLNKAKG